MICPKCNTQAVEKEFTTFKYWYCGTCKDEVRADIIKTLDYISRDIQRGSRGSGDYFSFDDHGDVLPIPTPPVIRKIGAPAFLGAPYGTPPSQVVKVPRGVYYVAPPGYSVTGQRFDPFTHEREVTITPIMPYRMTTISKVD